MNAIQRRQIAARPLIVRPWTTGPTQGVVLCSRHYRVYTTIRDSLQRRLMLQVLEAAHAHFMRLVAGTGRTKPLIGYVFRNRRQWAAFTHRTAGRATTIYMHIESGGYERRGVFVVWRTTLPEVLSVIAHEAWHQLSFMALKDHLPAWLDEGLATQNEAITWRQGQPHFTPFRNAARWSVLRLALAQRRLIPLQVLVHTQAGAVILESSSDVQIYYAEVWSLMLYLTHSRYRGALLKLLQAAQRGQLTPLLLRAGLTRQEIRGLTVRWNRRAGPLLFRTYFSPHFAPLQHRYLAFIRRLTSRWPPPGEGHRVR